MKKRLLSLALSLVMTLGCVVMPATVSAAETATNIAPNATVTTSYCSPWENLNAVQKTDDPASSAFVTDDQYGNWAEQGTQWVQYDFTKAQVISSSKVYWASDGGVLGPKSANLQYWDGDSWEKAADVAVDLDQYNEVSFPEITTKKVRLEMESNGASTGVKRWQVFGYESEIQLNEAPTLQAGLGYYTLLPNKMLLTSTVIDDGLPEGGNVTVSWKQVSGPADAVIEKPNAAVTYATTDTAGKYVFEVTATDGELSSTATTYVNVYDEEGKYGNPILPGMFPDPHIFYEDGKFYIYATSMENDAGSYGRASVWVSEDFVNWEMQLTNYPVYGEFGGDIWAPDIVKIGDKYYQFITRSGYYDTIIAVADSPVGPWENVREDGKAIVGGNTDVAGTAVAAYNMDSHPFVDDDGTVYMYWGWSESMVAKLTPDMKNIDGEVTFLKGTKWVAANGDHPQSLTVDLEAEYPLDEIQTSPEFRNVIYKYKIEYSSDGETWQTYADRSANDVACGDTYYSDTAADCTGRYVRITLLDSQGNWPSLYDFSVFSNGEKVSLNKPVEATTERGNGSEATNAVDNASGPFLTDYVEAPYVIKHDGTYYLLYSSGALHDGTYSVHYAMSDNPMGPFTTPENNVVLKSNEEETTKGPGHNSVLYYEGEYYIVYHQHNQPHVDGGGVFRQTAADKLEFNEDGTIKPVVPTQTGIGALLPYQDPGTDLAQGKYATATSVRDGYSVAEYALDHNNASKWKAADNTYPQSLTVDLESVSSISRIETAFEYPTLSYKYKIETSVDGETWDTYVDKTAEFPTAVCPHKDYKDVEARYVKITIEGCQRPENNAGIYSFQVYGEAGEELPTCSANAAIRVEDTLDGNGNAVFHFNLIDAENVAAAQVQITAPEGAEITGENDFEVLETNLENTYVLCYLPDEQGATFSGAGEQSIATITVPVADTAPTVKIDDVRIASFDDGGEPAWGGMVEIVASEATYVPEEQGVCSADAGIYVDRTRDSEGNAVFRFKLIDAKNIAAVEATVEVPEGAKIEGAGGFTYVGNESTGSLMVLTYLQEDTFTADGEQTVAIITVPQTVAQPTVKISDVRIASYDTEGEPAWGDPVHVVSAEATFMGFDLNGDGIVNLLDVAEAMRWYQATASDENWEEAQIADVDGNGVVNLEDLVQIVLNFT